TGDPGGCPTNPAPTPTPPSAALRAADGSRGLALVPRRGGKAGLAGGQGLRPHDHALAVLPLEHGRSVGDLKAVLIDCVVAEGVLRLELQQLVPHLVRVKRSRPFDRVDVQETPGVTGRRVIGRLVLELL